MVHPVDGLDRLRRAVFIGEEELRVLIVDLPTLGMPPKPSADAAAHTPHHGAGPLEEVRDFLSHGHVFAIKGLLASVAPGVFPIVLLL